MQKEIECVSTFYLRKIEYSWITNEIKKCLNNMTLKEWNLDNNLKEMIKNMSQ